MTLIVTRPAPDGDAFAALAAAAGVEAVLSPVMTIEFLDAPAEVAADEALAFTSANGVRAFARLNPDRAPAVYAVGAASAGEARAAGFVDVRAAGGDVESLADLIAATKRHSRIAHFAGSDRAGDLIAALAARGVSARRAVLYSAVSTRDLSPAAAAILRTDASETGVALFSPRSARLFIEQAAASGVVSALKNAVALCLSRNVADAAAATAWSRILIAREPSAEAMIALARGLEARP